MNAEKYAQRRRELLLRIEAQELMKKEADKAIKAIKKELQGWDNNLVKEEDHVQTARSK